MNTRSTSLIALPLLALAIGSSSCRSNEGTPTQLPTTLCPYTGKESVVLQEGGDVIGVFESIDLDDETKTARLRGGRVADRINTKSALIAFFERWLYGTVERDIKTMEVDGIVNNGNTDQIVSGSALQHIIRGKVVDHSARKIGSCLFVDDLVLNYQDARTFFAPVQKVLTVGTDSEMGRFFSETNEQGLLTSMRNNSYDLIGNLLSTISYPIGNIMNGVVLRTEKVGFKSINVITLRAKDVNPQAGATLTLTLLHRYYLTSPSDYRNFNMKLENDGGLWSLRTLDDLKSKAFDELQVVVSNKRGIDKLVLQNHGRWVGDMDLERLPKP